jgi:endonuclease/exonuclease/phosphatase (EEP) superfamily protein YafD
MFFTKLSTLVISTLLSLNLLAANANLKRSNSYDFGHNLPAPEDVMVNFGQASQTSLKKRFSLLVWNLHKGQDADFSKDYPELSYKKDILVNQEMLLNPLMMSVFNDLSGYYFTSATSFFMGSDQFRTGVVTASKVNPISVEYIKTDTLEPVVSSPKMSLVSRFPILNGEKILTIINIHGINFVLGDDYRHEMEKIVEAVKDLPPPMIFTGDFNTWSDERVGILRDAMKKLKLSSTHFFPDERMKFNDHVLDHFLYTDDLRIVEAKVEGFYKGSDHKPLEVIVEYSPRPPSRRYHRRQ